MKNFQLFSFREWQRWTLKKPKIHRWFIYLVLLRPLIDAFYKLKTISPLVSPLYIAAALTFILGLAAILTGPRKIGHSPIDKFFGFWAFLAVNNMIFISFIQKDPIALADSILRYTLPFYLFFFIRAFIRSRMDLIRLLQTFLYSEIFVALVFLFELLGGPIRTETSRGFARYVGVFADNYNYSFFITLVFLAFTYLYLHHREFRIKKSWLGGLLLLELAFLSRVVHVATWGIFAFLFIWFLYNASFIHKRTFVLLLLLAVLGYTQYGNAFKQQYLDPLTQDELAALRGEKSIERLGHGRMSRWTVMVPLWLSVSPTGKLMGLPAEMERRYLGMLSGSVHNEFLRILFLYGLIGLGLFVLILLLIIRRGLQMPPRERYIVIGSVIAFGMYAISGSSLFYAQLQYVVYAIFAYALLPSEYREITPAQESHA